MDYRNVMIYNRGMKKNDLVELLEAIAATANVRAANIEFGVEDEAMHAEAAAEDVGFLLHELKKAIRTKRLPRGHEQRVRDRLVR
jgi:hypothetical protein